MAGTIHIEKVKRGNYRHYKGGMYTAIMIAMHHETRRPMVVYVCHKTGSLNVRPLSQIESPITDPYEDNDAWDDWVEYEGQRVRRFTYVGDD